MGKLHVALTQTCLSIQNRCIVDAESMSLITVASATSDVYREEEEEEEELEFTTFQHYIDYSSHYIHTRSRASPFNGKTRVQSPELAPTYNSSFHCIYQSYSSSSVEWGRQMSAPCIGALLRPRCDGITCLFLLSPVCTINIMT